MTLLTLTTPLTYSASKFQRSSILLEVNELKKFFYDLQDSLGMLFCYRIGSVLQENLLHFSLENIIEQYGSYLAALKAGKVKEVASFSLAITLDPKTLYMVDVGEGRKIGKLRYPSVQMVTNAICYLPELNIFKEKLYGQELIPWGLQFSYPQLFQDSETYTIHNALSECVNGTLFKTMGRWFREHSRPTFFSTPQGQVKSTIRLGKECYSWINRHPQLVQAGILVDE